MKSTFLHTFLVCSLPTEFYSSSLDECGGEDDEEEEEEEAESVTLFF